MMKKKSLRLRKAGPAQPLDDLVKKAQTRHYLTIEHGKITYYCGGTHFTRRWDLPEEPIRAHAYAWLTIEKGYPPQRILVETKVKGYARGRKKRTDLVLFANDDLNQVLLVVENKRKEISSAAAKEAVNQGTDYANSRGARYFLFDCESDSKLFRFDGARRREPIGTRDQFPTNIEAEAYVLLEVEPTHSKYIAKWLTDAHQGVLYAAAVWGRWDVISHVQMASAHEMTKFLTAIQQAERVVRTETYLVKPKHEGADCVRPPVQTTKWAFVFMKVQANRVREMVDKQCRLTRAWDSGNRARFPKELARRPGNEFKDFVRRSGIWRSAVP